MPSTRSVTPEVTALLRAWRAGDTAAGDELLRRIYRELKQIAAAHLRHERADHTLEATALVHEAYLRLLRQRGVDWRDRAHFYGLAATMMRRVLVDHARARSVRRKAREQGDVPITLVTRRGPELEILDLDRSLTLLADLYPRQARVVEMRYFAELGLEEIASCLDISAATVKRDWLFARAWLRARMTAGSAANPGSTG